MFVMLRIYFHPRETHNFHVVFHLFESNIKGVLYAEQQTEIFESLHHQNHFHNELSLIRNQTNQAFSAEGVSRDISRNVPTYYTMESSISPCRCHQQNVNRYTRLQGTILVYVRRIVIFSVTFIAVYSSCGACLRAEN